MQKKINIVTGQSGDGKTTWIKGAVDFINCYSKNITGIISPGRFINNEKIGIDCILIPSNQRLNLATKKTHYLKGISNKWEFNEDTINKVNDFLNQIDTCEYFICDEIGPLELNNNQGFISALDFLEAGNYKNALIIVRSSLLDKFIKKFKDKAEIQLLDIKKECNYNFLL